MNPGPQVNPDSGMPAALLGHGPSQSVLHPAVAVAMILGIILLLLLPRKYAAVPFLLVVILTPYGQELYVGGLHFFVFRILILSGWLRIVWTKVSSRTEIFAGGFQTVDAAFLFWAVYMASAQILVSRGAASAIFYQGAFLWDVLGGYVLLRFLIQDESDVARVIKTFVVIVGILGMTMLNEKLRDQNIFGFLGSIPVSPEIREGSIRAQGPFAISILAGTFAATLLPLFLYLWFSGKAKASAVIGVVGCTVMVVASASATPLLTYLAVLLGISLWPMRKNMRMIRWGLVVLLISLALVMKAPVWFLLDHLDVVAGNSGYHRAMLIDTCIRHFKDWWLVGTNQTMNWGFDMWDLTNQYVDVAEMGGLAALVSFILFISWSFGRIGMARKLAGGDHKKEWFLWLLGVALFSHAVAFFGIHYFDQTKFAFYALFAIIIAATAPILEPKVIPQEKSVFNSSHWGVDPAASAVMGPSRFRTMR